MTTPSAAALAMEQVILDHARAVGDCRDHNARLRMGASGMGPAMPPPSFEPVRHAIHRALAAHLRALADDPAAVERVARWIKDRFYPRYAAWEHLDDMTRNDLLDDARVALAALGGEA